MLKYFRSTRQEPLFMSLKDSIQLSISVYKARLLLFNDFIYIFNILCKKQQIKYYSVFYK